MDNNYWENIFNNKNYQQSNKMDDSLMLVYIEK